MASRSASPGSAQSSPRRDKARVQVMVRVRPFSQREKDYSAARSEELRPILAVSGSRVGVLDPEHDYQEHMAFEYDECFWSCKGFDSDNELATQETIYEKTGKPMLASALAGYNCCIFAYGQTGAGKTFTMLGAPGCPGVSYMLIDDLFMHIQKQKAEDPGTVYKIEISFMEIYNEQCRDLFNAHGREDQFSDVKIRQDPLRGIVVQGLTTKEVQSSKECAKEMERGVSERALAETKMNATSSRSHAICQIAIQAANSATGLRRNALINLVDLAGSERLKMSGVEGTAAKEAKNINLSLSTLRKVFDVLIANSKRKRQDVPPYRESMLTWVLKESLGGNSKTMMIAAVSPHIENFEDTISTLRYALKAKAIVCKVICNEQPNAKMVENLKGQVAELEAMLAAGGGISAEERKELEEQVAGNQKALEEAQDLGKEMAVRQEELEKELAALEEQKVEMKHEMDNHRKQKFSAAFRSAFVIKKKKTEGMQIAAEISELRERSEQSDRRVDELERELKAAKAEASDVKRDADRRVRQLRREIDDCRGSLSEAELALSDMRIRVKELEPLCARLRDHCAEQGDILQKLERSHSQLQVEHDRLLRQQSDVETRSRRRVEEATSDRDDMARRKEHYKKQCIALQMLHEADTRIIEAIRGGRQAAVATARTEAKIEVKLAEARLCVDSTAPGLHSATEQAKRLSEELPEQHKQLQQLATSLREYRQAAAEWAADSTALRSKIQSDSSPAADVGSPPRPPAAISSPSTDWSAVRTPLDGVSPQRHAV
eukprot:TRINITY_DN2371_c0_g1_i2.p1 TRINITY_DN2371_c0_g1~~TRINITY_DN2371_c0_g1_i2.p1  ORF type:complete len:778 (+),score=271.42 TRINITY_DN2371_c0_g1_i2:73-2406(+)